MTNYCDKISNLKIIKICSNNGQKEITVIQFRKQIISNHESLINTKHDLFQKNRSKTSKQSQKQMTINLLSSNNQNDGISSLFRKIFPFYQFIRQQIRHVPISQSRSEMTFVPWDSISYQSLNILPSVSSMRRDIHIFIFQF